MKKNFLQDVIPPVQRRSIRDIPIPNNKKHTSQTYDDKNDHQDIHVHKIHKDDPDHTIDITPPNQPPQINKPQHFFEEEKPKRKSSKTLGVITVVILLFAVLFLNRINAEVTLVPKQAEVNLSQNFDIFDKNKDAENNIGIGYKKLEIQKSSAISIEPSGEQNVSQKASGKIKVFNKSTTKPKTLIANTRFETEKGLIFRVDKNIQIPGYTEKNGSIIPGEIEIEVTADKTGKEYNIGKTNFTIPGFKDFPDLYTTIYAESVTDMTGGFEGKKKVISEADKTRALEELKNQVKEMTTQEIKNSEGEFIIVYNIDNIAYSGLKEEDKDNKVTITLSSSLEAYAFESNEFAEYVIKNNIPGSDPQGSMLKNKDEIKFEIQSNSTADDKKLAVNGLVKIDWKIDEEKIQNALAQKSREESNSILSSFPEISSAEVILKPFWKSTLPKAEKINIIIKK